MRNILIILSLLLSNVCSAQIAVDSSKAIQIQRQKIPQVTVNLPSTLQIENISKTNDSILIKNMPWIVALIIGILSAFVNFGIGNRLRLSNEKNLLRQIETSKDVKLLEFKATISAKNRQEWINELRHTISDFLSIAMQLTPEEHEKLAELNPIDLSKYFDKFYYTKAKIELLLNSEKKEQKDVLDKVKAVVSTLTKENGESGDIREARENLIFSSRNLFDLHWKKIKNLE